MPGPSEPFSVEVNGSRYEIDPMSITLGERREVRQEVETLGGETDGWDYVAGLIWLAVRRVNPDISIKQIMDAVTVGALEPPKVVDALDPEA